MPGTIFYSEEDLIEIYNECLDTEEGLNDDTDESPYSAGEDVGDDFEDIDFDSYIVEYDDDLQELTITLLNVFSEDFDGEDVEMVSVVEEDEDGDIFYSPFEFVLD